MSRGQIMLRADRHLLALSAAAVAGVGVVGIVENADAAVVYSGVMNVNIPADFTGVYLNLSNNLTGRPASAVPGWDINPWVSSGQWRIFPSSTGPGGIVAPTAGNASASALNPGDPIGPAQAYATSSATLLPNGNPTLIGIRFSGNDALIHYGWARISNSNSPLTAGTLVDWGWEDQANTPIAAGAGIPEPSSLALLAVGAVGLLRRRGN